MRKFIGLYKVFLLLLVFSVLYFIHPRFFKAQAQAAKISAKKGAAGVLAGNPCASITDPTRKQACKEKVKNRINSLGITWYYTWYTDLAGAKFSEDFIENVPMVGGAGSNSDRTYTAGELEHFKTYARQHPGSYWLIWNEVDRAGQADIPIEKQVEIYPTLISAIKSADSSAKFIIGGYSYDGQWAGWAGAFLNTYRSRHGGVNPDFDGWHVHLYMCQYNKDVWRQQFTSFRNWINTSGGGSQKELWLTEWGCLDGPRDQIIKDQLDWMEGYSGIQRYSWFLASGNDAIWSPRGIDLFNGYNWDNPSFGLTSLGQVYASYPLNPTPVITRTPTPMRTPSTTPTPTGFSPTPTRTPTPNPTITPGGPTLSPTPRPPTSTPASPSHTPVPTQAPCPSTKSKGDANCDGVINATDYDIWKKEFTAELSTKTADFNRDGAVSLIDYEIWRRTDFNAS